MKEKGATYVLVRTNSADVNFRKLVKALDEELSIRDGADHAFYAAYNKIDFIHHVVVAFNENIPVGCGAIKHFSPGLMEIKRMFVDPEFRSRGIARTILNELENWARQLSCEKCVLETGHKQPEAIALYQKCGYTVIPNYGQYAGVSGSICFEKIL